MNETRIKLYNILTKRFSDSDLRTLCFALDVDYELLSGANKADKARELIVFLENRGNMSELVEVGNQLRPDISWPNIIETESAELLPLKIMVTGGRTITENARQLAHLIGQQIVSRGHTLLTNGAVGVDKASSEGALQACNAKNLNPNTKIQVFRPRKSPTPSFGFGNLQIVGTGYQERRNFVIQRSDVIALLGGGGGTKDVLSQARIMAKPIIPIGIGDPMETAVGYWHQLRNRQHDNLPIIPIEDKDLLSIGPNEQDLEHVALSAVVISERLIYGEDRTP